MLQHTLLAAQLFLMCVCARVLVCETEVTVGVIPQELFIFFKDQVSQEDLPIG